LSNAQDRAIKALFGHKPFPVNDMMAGERDGYEISVPALTRAIESAQHDERARCLEVVESIAKMQTKNPVMRDFARDIGDAIAALKV
jgi:hypothetical protein